MGDADPLYACSSLKTKPEEGAFVLKMTAIIEKRCSMRWRWRSPPKYCNNRRSSFSLARILIVAARIELVSPDLSDEQERRLWRMVGDMESWAGAHAVSLEDELELFDVASSRRLSEGSLDREAHATCGLRGPSAKRLRASVTFVANASATSPLLPLRRDDVCCFKSATHCSQLVESHLEAVGVATSVLVWVGVAWSKSS